MKNKYIPIITDITKFESRIDEIDSSVSYDTVKHVISEIKKALYNNSSIPALAAPQIGHMLRLFVVRTSKTESDRFKVFLNPMIVSSEGLHLSREICASIPDKEYIIPRKNTVHIAYQAANGEVCSETYSGAYSEVIQHMIELLDGITLADYGLDLDDLGGAAIFDKASKKQKTEAIALYLDTLKNYSSDLMKEIESDPELKNLNDTISFMTGMLTGDITPIESNDDTKKDISENGV